MQRPGDDDYEQMQGRAESDGLTFNAHGAGVQIASRSQVMSNTSQRSHANIDKQSDNKTEKRVLVPNMITAYDTAAYETINPVLGRDGQDSSNANPNPPMAAASPRFQAEVADVSHTMPFNPYQEMAEANSVRNPKDSLINQPSSVGTRGLEAVEVEHDDRMSQSFGLSSHAPTFGGNDVKINTNNNNNKRNNKGSTITFQAPSLNPYIAPPKAAGVHGGAKGNKLQNPHMRILRGQDRLASSVQAQDADHQDSDALIVVNKSALKKAAKGAHIQSLQEQHYESKSESFDNSESDAQKQQKLIAQQIMAAQLAQQSAEPADSRFRDSRQSSTLIKQKIQPMTSNMPAFFLSKNKTIRQEPAHLLSSDEGAGGSGNPIDNSEAAEGQEGDMIIIENIEDQDAGSQKEKRQGNQGNTLKQLQKRYHDQGQTQVDAPLGFQGNLRHDKNQPHANPDQIAFYQKPISIDHSSLQSGIQSSMQMQSQHQQQQKQTMNKMTSSPANAEQLQQEISEPRSVNANRFEEQKTTLDNSINRRKKVQAKQAEKGRRPQNEQIADDEQQQQQQPQMSNRLGSNPPQSPYQHVYLHQANSTHQQRQDTDDDQIDPRTQNSTLRSALNYELNRHRPKIQTQLMMETWLWEKEQSHRLFNFQEGYRIVDKQNDGASNGGSLLSCIGLDSNRTETCIIGSHIIQKNGPNDILLQQASEFKEQSVDVPHHAGPRDEKKLLNIIYHDGFYYLFEPRNKEENEDNIIDNHLWFIVKFMPKKCTLIGLGDVVRFGRIPFKITKLVLDVKKQQEDDEIQKEQIAKAMSYSQVEQEANAELLQDGQYLEMPSDMTIQRDQMIDVVAEGGGQEHPQQQSPEQQVIDEGNYYSSNSASNLVPDRRQRDQARPLLNPLEHEGDNDYTPLANPIQASLSPSYVINARSGQLPPNLSRDRDGIQSQSVNVPVRNQMEFGAPTNISENAVPQNNNEGSEINDLHRQGSHVDNVLVDNTSYSGAQTQINQFPEDGAHQDQGEPIDEGEAGFGRAERNQQMDQEEQNVNQEYHDPNNQYDGYGGYELDDEDDLPPAPGADHSYRSSDPDAGWVEAPNDQLISIRTQNNNILSVRKDEAGNPTLQRHKASLPHDSPYEAYESRFQETYRQTGRNMNESGLPLRQANQSHLLGYDETFVEVFESNSAMVSQRGTHRITGRGDPSGQLPPISFTQGISKRPNLVTGGLGATLAFQGHISKKHGAASDNASSISKQSDMVCRICLEEEGTSENPFITPCKCVGSVRHIHVQCVREWLDNKKQSQRQDGVYSYYWEELTCELCKEPLKLRNQVLINEKESSVKVTKEYFLLNYKVPQHSKYMVLESDINCLSKAIHVIDFDFKKEYKVGRRVNNDITVSDISVSRAQASIRLRGDQLFVEDHDSKFGTFVKIRGLLKICSESMGLGKSNKFNYTVPVQVEKKCFFIRPIHRYSWWLRGCCSLCPPSGCSCVKKSRKAPGQLYADNDLMSTGQDRQNGSLGGETEFDHFLDVYNRYPESAQEILLPHLYQYGLMQKLQKEKMLDKMKLRSGAKDPQCDERQQPKSASQSSQNQPPQFQRQTSNQQSNQGSNPGNNRTQIPDDNDLNNSAYEDQDMMPQHEGQNKKKGRSGVHSNVQSAGGRMASRNGSPRPIPGGAGSNSSSNGRGQASAEEAKAKDIDHLGKANSQQPSHHASPQRLRLGQTDRIRNEEQDHSYIIGQRSNVGHEHSLGISANLHRGGQGNL